jgi:hypothetical protein
VQRSVPQLGLSLVLLTLALYPAISRAAAPPPPVGAAVTGVVRDVQGVAQAGALVQVMAAGLASPRTTFTDLHGRYSIKNLTPGKYVVQASAALFVPTTRDNLQLQQGHWSVVNLTLATLFNTSVWLPAERRKADETGDDWKWTLRSSASRPMLRMVDDGLSVSMSSSAVESHRAQSQARESFSSGDGGFSHSGSHNVLAQDFDMGDGSNAVVRFDIGLPDSLGVLAPSTAFAVGFERRLGFGGAARTVASYQNHPEIVGGNSLSGTQSLQMASAQQMNFGDSIQVDFGGEIYAVRTTGYGLSSAPFVRVAVHANDDWTIGYRMATAKDLQGFDDLNSVDRDLPVAVAMNGGVQVEHGRHQELSLARRTGKGIVQVAIYHDDLDHPVVAGSAVAGYLPSADGFTEPLPQVLSSAQPLVGMLTDTIDGSFRFLGPGYTANGMNVTITHPLSKGMWAAVQYSTGSALTAHGAAGYVSSASAAPGLHSIAAQSATFAVRGRLIRSGTKLRAAYRWQPLGLVTAVDPYRSFSDQAYLSISAKQPIHLGRMLPPGLEGTVDITNLLAQGYQPFLSPDGHTLFLAQSPRTIEAGLCLTF